MVSGTPLQRPAREFHPDFRVLPGSVFFYLKLALVAGVLIGSPVIFYQIWRFVAPGLYKHEKKLLLPFSLLSALCFIGGAAFGYYVVFPPAFRFLLGYTNSYLSALPSVQEYFSLSLRLLIAFGVVFELPIFMVLLARLGIVSAPFLRKHRRYAFLIAFVIAAILTPTPDVVNQMLMGGPLVILYEISIIAVALFGGKKKEETLPVAEDEETLSVVLEEATPVVEKQKAQADTVEEEPLSGSENKEKD